MNSGTLLLKKNNTALARCWADLYLYSACQSVLLHFLIFSLVSHHLRHITVTSLFAGPLNFTASCTILGKILLAISKKFSLNIMEV